MRAAAILLLALTFASTPLAQAPGLDVSGTIVAASNGEPLARVRVDGPGDERTYPDVLTDDHGRFTVRVPREASVRLRLSKAGFAALTTTVASRQGSAPLRLEMGRGTAITGRIVGTNGTPMRARVYVHPDIEGRLDPIGAMTDDRGEFRVGGLPPGRYIVSTGGAGTWTSRVGPDGERVWIPYVPGGFVPPRPSVGNPQRVVETRAGEEVAGLDFSFDIVPPNFGGRSLDIKLQDQPLPPGSLSGTVVDERGEPMQGVVIRLQRLRTINGTTVAVTANDPVDTDDRGRFRVFALKPGEYVVAGLVTATLGGPREYTVTYAGGGFDLDSATRWLVGDVEEAGVGIEMVPAELFSVSGTVRSSSGAPGSGTVRVRLTHRSGRSVPEPKIAPLGADGRFSFAGLVPGDYVVQASIGGTLGTPTEFGAAFVAVGDRPAGPVALQTAVPSIMSGRILVEDGTEGQRPAEMTLRVLPADPDRAPPNESGTASLATRSDGSFYVTGLTGRNRIVLGGASEGWFMKELLLGRHDVAVEPFDFAAARTFDDAILVMSPRGAVITGQPEPDRDGQVAPYWAVVFPADAGQRISRSQFIRHARSSDDGTFRLAGLPPGSYYVAVLRTLTPPSGLDEWQPAELDRLAGLATRVTVAAGETRRVRPGVAF